MFSTAVRAAGPIWRAGCWIRTLLLAGMWTTLLAATAGDALRGAAQLLLATAAVMLAFAHLSAEALARLGRIPGLTRLVDHLASTSGRATVDASGLLEGAGAFLATWLYVGPFPLVSLPTGVRILGVTLAVLYVWEAVLQAVIDPGWYSTKFPPPRGMRRFRVLIPVILCAIVLATVFPYNDVAGRVPLPVVLVLSALPLLYYPIRGAFDVLLRASVSHARSSYVIQCQETSIDLHSQVKNSATLLQRYVDESDPVIEEVRSLTREVMMRVEELRRDVLATGERSGPRSFSQLWETVLRIVPSPRRGCCVLNEGSAALVLSAADYQIARRVLPDLVTNALNAGANLVHVNCVLDDECTRVRVADDGEGPAQAPDHTPHSSLGLLHTRLSMMDGGIAWNRAGIETVVEAHWRSQGHDGVTRLRSGDGWWRER
ncbi:hypothetical protein [Actinocrispum wychmicini]|uniref:Uncharacterized protein n=1 Tax=Actinocrispum wychmicini TaxID=1213861 RepID=A0A4R2K6Z9_9PSEU|nr:hypothetical protein [Actinocrispum wychmicini]TCO62125.1 hypothetical protein EV192_102262 [Actinocrispum wychmicini]